MYEEIAAKIWTAYKLYASTAYVARRGFELTGITTPTEQEVDVAETFMRRGESGLEHQAKTAFLVGLFASNFYNYFGQGLRSSCASDCSEMWPFMTTLLCHDVGEVRTGDIPDDGNALHGTKDQAERAVFVELAEGFGREDAQALVSNFESFQERRDFTGMALYALDKLEAVLTLLFLEQYEHYATITAKPVPTDQDLEFMRFTGEPAAADCWAAHMKCLINDFPMAIRDPVYAVLEAAVVDVRGEMFHWWNKPLPEEI